MKIPMVDLKGQYHLLKDEIDQGLLNALESTQFILGPNVQSFEKEAAYYLGVKHTIGVASGTDALHLALDAAGIGEGDEVITTPFTFIATAEAIRYVGAIPVFVDINPLTFNIDLGQIEAAITTKTKAVIPVHLFGQPVDMNALMSLCNTYNLVVIEDCAQSFGAHINNQQTGSFGSLGAFSFFPSKNLGCCGDGGLISTNSDELADRVNVLRNHGSTKRYHHNMIGYNSRLDELQAVILRVKLNKIDAFNQGRHSAAQTYRNLLADTDVITPQEDGIGYHVFHQYTCMHARRDEIIKALQDNDIGCAIYYPIPLHKQEVFAAEYQDLSLPNTEHVVSQCFSLPIFPEITEDQLNIISDTIKSAL